jgi:hypothetical protein
MTISLGNVVPTNQIYVQILSYVPNLMYMLVQTNTLSFDWQLKLLCFALSK